MAGYSRPGSGWDFSFDGINTVDVADHIKPSEMPLATNIRALADRSVMTRPGYTFLFSAPDCPTPVTTEIKTFYLLVQP